METCGGCRDRPGIGPGRCIESRRTPDGADSEDKGVAVGALLDCQWDGVRSAGVERLLLPALWHQDT